MPSFRGSIRRQKQFPGEGFRAPFDIHRHFAVQDFDRTKGMTTI